MMYKHTLILLLALGIAAIIAGCPTQKPAENTAASGDPAAVEHKKEIQTADNGFRAGDSQMGAEKSKVLATDFEYTLFDGTTHKLSENFGKPLVVNFWADWCPPCVEELPHFEEVWKEKNGQFNVVAVAVNGSNDPKAFIQQQGLTMPFATDINGADVYGITSIPVTIFINKDGTISGQIVGGMDKDTFEKSLSKIL